MIGGIYMKWLILTVFYFLYWFICFLCMRTDQKNLAGLRSYPDDMQAIVRSNTKLKNKAPAAKSVPSILLGNFILFTAVFSALGILCRPLLQLGSYRDSFLYFLILGEGLGVFDLLIIDLLWWRNTKRIRFSFLPEQKYYQNPDKHIQSFLRGIPLFAVIAAAAAGIVTVL